MTIDNAANTRHSRGPIFIFILLTSYDNFYRVVSHSSHTHTRIHTLHALTAHSIFARFTTVKTPRHRLKNNLRGAARSSRACAASSARCAPLPRPHTRPTPHAPPTRDPPRRAVAALHTSDELFKVPPVPTVLQTQPCLAAYVLSRTLVYVLANLLFLLTGAGVHPRIPPTPAPPPRLLARSCRACTRTRTTARACRP